MAHLMVSGETIICGELPHDENAGVNRSIGKHKRISSSDMELGCTDGHAPDSTKRRALVSITNQIDKGRSSRNSINKSLQKRATVRLTKSPSPKCKSPVQVSYNLSPIVYLKATLLNSLTFYSLYRHFNLAWVIFIFLQ